MTDTARDKAWAEWHHGSPELFPEQYEAFNAGWDAGATRVGPAFFPRLCHHPNLRMENLDDGRP